MDSLFQIAANAAVAQDLASKGAGKLSNVVVKRVQKTIDAKDLRAAGTASSVPYRAPPSLPRYAYTGIPNSSSIRVLELAAGEADDPVRCILKAADLDDSPEYEAISYCWGGPPDERSILCGEGSLLITKNLYEALHQLRAPEATRTVWADAICINQEDLAERGQQVPLMGRIYQQCSQCIVWLGIDEQDDYAAVNLLAKLSQLKLKQGSKAKPWTRLNTTPRQWDSLRKLLDRPWFIRMWTLQEIIIPRKAIILCGKFEWEVDEFFDLIKFISLNQGENDLGGVSYGMLQCLKVYTGRQMRHFNDVGANPTNILGLLRDARERDAGDKRDKVFAVLGLCEEDIVQAIRPNYDDTIAEVYQRVAQLMLESPTKPLRILSAAGLAERGDEVFTLASWIPDWSSRTTFTAPIRSFEELGAFLASGDLGPDIRFSFAAEDSVLCLHLQGKIVAQISDFIDINNPGFQKHWQEENYPVRTTKEKLVNIYGNMVFGPFLADDEPRSLMQWFVMECTKSLGGKRCVNDDRKLDILWKLMSRESSAMDPALDEKQKKKFKEYACPPSHDKVEGGKTLAPFIHDLGIWTQSRKFFTGARGGVGWAPLESKKGDMVCVLKGAELPYVLRKADDRKSWYLVGHCYASGVMHGEACDNDRIGWQEIILK